MRQLVLENTAYPALEVIVLDNNSSDASAFIAERFAASDPRIHSERLPENRGFAGGNNAAAARANGEYLVVSNPDTMVTPGWIGWLIESPDS